MKISIGAKIIDGPWGGGNLFFKNLQKYLSDKGHTVVFDLLSKDIDIILFNNDIIETSDLCIPHKHMHERNFVLIPLNEIAAEHMHPKYNKTVADLLEESKDTENVVEYAV